ncbi:MAG: hypothetical protein IPH96_02755 [Saprospiraceae bacterium]|nr:hypothetical protein [Saprospiraceae bacterium]
MNNQYTLTGVVTFTDPPMSGKLFITVPGGGSQMITGPFVSPINYSISGLVSDGMTHTVTATFELDTACSKSTTYSAPISCNNSTCNCSDYIYLNDVSNFDGVNGYIHKFRVNADGSVTEMPNGTTGTLPWFPVEEDCQILMVWDKT